MKGFLGLRSHSFTKPMTVLISTTLSDFSNTSRHAAESAWNTFFMLMLVPREVMSRSNFRLIIKVWNR